MRDTVDENCLLGYNAAYSVENQPTLRSNSLKQVASRALLRGGDMFLRNVERLSTDHAALYARIGNFYNNRFEELKSYKRYDCSAYECCGDASSQIKMEGGGYHISKCLISSQHDAVHIDHRHDVLEKYANADGHTIFYILYIQFYTTIVVHM
jgi:hypothetical protein